MSDQLAYQNACDLISKLEQAEIGALELCDYYIKRIENIDTDINAVVVRDFERARDAALVIDNLKQADKGPLFGLPLTVKESFNIAGLPTTWGLEAFQNSIAEQDADVVQRYKRAGAVVLGKTNVPEDLADFQSYNAMYGTTNNPWDTKRTPGGSSGGAAAALAAGLTTLETGSDIGGSIRNPAHYCGVYGHKPTWSVVPPLGHGLPGVLAAPDIAVCGPLARSAEDLALAMDIITGPETLRSSGWQLALPRPQKKQLRDYRVAVWMNDEQSAVDGETQAIIENLADVLEKAGATVSFSARPDIDVKRSHTTYMTLMHSIMGASASKNAYQKSQLIASQLSADDDSPAALIARGMSATHRAWLQANNYREKLRYQWRDFFLDWDILLCPQMATAAFEHDQNPKLSARTVMVDDQERSYFEQIFWSGLTTTAYLPSTVFPAGRTQAKPAPGLPIGIQAVGAEYNDYLTIDFARLVAEQIGGFTIPPNFVDKNG
ncbi:MAG: amidase [Pseudomonadales bacterium]